MPALILMIKKVLREQYPKKTHFLTRLGSDFASALFFFGIGRSVIWKDQFNSVGDYFSFVMAAELGIKIALSLFQSAIEESRYLERENIWQLLCPDGLSAMRLITLRILATFIIEGLFLIPHLLILYLFLSLDFDWIIRAWPATMAMAFIALPLMVGLGLFASFFYLKFRRGENIMMKIASFMLMASGTYFPLGILPESLHQALAISPFFAMATNARNVITLGQWKYILQPSLLLSFFIGIFLCFLARLTFKRFQIRLVTD